MVANKQLIFGMEDKVAQLGITQPNNDVNTRNQKIKTQKAKTKSSNLGVRLSMKNVTKSPVPNILPGIQPNQSVQIKGVVNMAQVVIPDTKTQPLPGLINPAITHPAATNRKNHHPASKKSLFKPEITHPASLAQAAAPAAAPAANQAAAAATNQAGPQLIMPVAEKMKLGNFKERLEKRNMKSPNKTIKGNKNNKRESTKKQSTKKQSTKMIFN